MSMSAFQVVLCHKLDSLWKMLLNEDQRMFESKQVTDNYKILTSCNGINEYKHKWQCFINYLGKLGMLQVKID